MEELKEAPKAIDWPKFDIGAETFVLRYSYSSNYQLAKWKKSIGTATNIELGAAMCGKFDAKGQWHSAGFANPVELADLISNLEPKAQISAENALLSGISDALKKAFPALEIAQTPAQAGGTKATKDPSNSGPSPRQEVA